VCDHAADASLPSLLTALQEPLGLKLEYNKNPIDVMVIDHIVISFCGAVMLAVQAKIGRNLSHPTRLVVKSQPTSQTLLGEQMGKKLLREKGKTQRVVLAAIEQGGLRYEVKKMARKISTSAISSWHFPK
jgi:Protein of unknown function (DUF3738)